MSPDPLRHALDRAVPVLAAAAEAPDLARRFVRLLVNQTATLRGMRLLDWPEPPREEHADLRDVAREVARMHEGRPVEWIGAFHERLLAADLERDGSGRPLRHGRKRAGAFYTPAGLVAHLLDAALEPLIAERLDRTPDPVAALTSIRLLDPSCGGGNFLLAAARRLASHLVRRSALTPPEATALVIGSCIHGVDIDAAAVEACIGSLMLEAGCPSLSHRTLAGNILHGDSLTGTLAAAAPAAWSPRSDSGGGGRRDRGHQLAEAAPLHWPVAFPHVLAPRGGDAGFDLVVGNPPFLNQLEKATTLSRARDAQIRAVSEGVGASYTDLSATFLWRSVQLAAPGGRVAMVQPQSLLASRDAGPVRKAIAGRASIESIWIADDHLFEGASVYTCAPVLRIGGDPQGHVKRSRGAEFAALPAMRIDVEAWASQDTWSPLAAAAWGVPEVGLPKGPTIGDIAKATADFRDQYYGLDGFLVEDAAVSGATDASHPRLVTTGLIDLARMRWGERPVRMLRRSWQAPRIDRALMDREGTLGPWLERRLVPKVLLATQTRILEAWVDESGAAVPCIPLLTITPRSGVDLWKLAAAVASPVACAVAMERHAGTALTMDAIKLSAAQVLLLPLPTHADAWDAAAARFQAASSATTDAARLNALLWFGRVMGGAYGLGGDLRDRVVAWWESRLTAPAHARRRAKAMPC